MLERCQESRTRPMSAMKGHLLAVHVTPANAQERAQVFELCEAVQTATGHTVELA